MVAASALGCQAVPADENDMEPNDMEHLPHVILKCHLPRVIEMPLVKEANKI